MAAACTTGRGAGGGQGSIASPPLRAILLALSGDRATAPGSRRLRDQARAAGIAMAGLGNEPEASPAGGGSGAGGSKAVAKADPPAAEPAVLAAAAARLGAAPAETAVVADDAATVQAARGAGFALVLGIAPPGEEAALARVGAAAVAADPAELRLAPDGRLGLATLATLPAVRERLDELRARLAGRRLFVGLDYDGTLTPIVADHTKAVLGAAMRAAVERLARQCPVAIVSGRDLAVLRRLVPLEGVVFAGSHGFEIAADAAFGRVEIGAEALPDLDAAERALRVRLASIPGHAVERKRFSIAVHHRQVAAADAPRLRAIVDEVLAGHPRLRRGLGRKVIELQPDLPWGKGAAFGWLAARLGLEGPDVLPLYLGDDLTDEDVFRALAGRGIGIAVRGAADRPTAADYALADPEEVRWFLDLLPGLSRAA